jgi:hypothetical protein
MSRQLNYEKYPLPSLLLDLIVKLDKRVNTKKGKQIIYAACVKELKDTLIIPEQLIYLDFELKVDKFGDYIEIKPNNIITGLWFCGLYPLDAEEVMESKKFYLGSGYYKFDGRTKKIKFIETKKI